jgi:hypothetical protein
MLNHGPQAADHSQTKPFGQIGRGQGSVLIRANSIPNLIFNPIDRFSANEAVILVVWGRIVEV